MVCFFFQAEDGIRDADVTGVQTCALPIYTTGATPPSRGQGGFGLIEIMVGLVIGLIAVLVIYQVFTVSEGFKRNTTAAGEAQMNGLFSTFVLGMELGNGGAAMAVSRTDLASCADTG